MAYTYDGLWKLLIDKKMNKTELKKRISMSSATLARLTKNQEVSMAVLARICKELNCNFADIVEYIDD